MQHVSLDVDDLDAALRFWSGAMGFPIAPRPASLGEGGAWLDVPGGGQLHLVAVADHVPPATSQHVAFAVADVDAAVARLRAAGHDASDPFDVGAGRQSFVRDPAGNLVELNQPSSGLG